MFHALPPICALNFRTSWFNVPQSPPCYILYWFTIELWGELLKSNLTQSQCKVLHGKRCWYSLYIVCRNLTCVLFLMVVHILYRARARKTVRKTCLYVLDVAVWKCICKRFLYFEIWKWPIIWRLQIYFRALYMNSSLPVYLLFQLCMLKIAQRRNFS